MRFVRPAKVKGLLRRTQRAALLREPCGYSASERRRVPAHQSGRGAADLKGFALCRRPPPLDLPCFFSRFGLSSSAPEQLSTLLPWLLTKAQKSCLGGLFGVQMASWRPLGGLLGGLGAILAALSAPVNDLDGSGKSLGALRSALGALWEGFGRLLEAS